TGTVSSLLDPGYLWFLPPVLGVLVLALLGPRSVAGTAPRVRRVALACFVVGALPASFELARFTFGGTGMRVFSETQNVGRLGVVNAHLFQVGRALRSMGGRSVLRDEDRREVATFLVERTPTRSGARFGVARGSNLVVLQVEALQDWVVDA